MRNKIIRLVIFGLFAVITVELFYVQIISGRRYYHLSKHNRIRIVPLEGGRGRILDRNGKIMADNRPAYHVMVMPQDIEDIKMLFAFLSKVLNVEQKIMMRRYRQKKLTPFTPVVVAQNIERKKAMELEEHKYRFPGLMVQEGSKRFYPSHKNSAHVLGYVGRISQAKRERYQEYGYTPQMIVGHLGVEEYYDDHLRGDQGGVQIEVNSRGKQVRLLSLKDPTKGKDISLTIDSGIQSISQEILEERRGAIVIMDMANGEVLGLTSSPSYDPNDFVQRDNAKKLSVLFSNQEAPLLNRTIKGVFPPGSVFKVPVAVSALESKKINANTSFMCEGHHTLGGIRFGCTHVHRLQNLVESLAHSCNVYYYRAGLKLGADWIYKYARLLGLGRLTHIDLPYEKKGKLPHRRKRLLTARRWYTGDTLNFSIGQGDILTTPLQLVRMMAIVASEGTMVQPHVVKTIGKHIVKDHDFKRQIKISKDTFRTIKKGLRATVTDYSGTAHVLDLKEIYVAGKTGTAQSSRDKEHHAWFVGYAKGETKNVAFCVFLEHGGSSQNACVLARKLLLRMKEESLI